MSCKRGLPPTEIGEERQLNVLFVCSITYSSNVLEFCSKAFTIVLTSAVQLYLYRPLWVFNNSVKLFVKYN